VPVALAIFICWPIAELLVAIQVADAIGVLATIVLLIAGWPLGAWALRSRGRAAWRRLATALSDGGTARTPSGPPAREVVDGALVVVGGMLLMVPGFITDVLGIFLLLPPTRALARPLLIRNLRSKFVVRAVRFTSKPYDVDSTARDIDQPQLRS
jgi:UPF0716 protein FxsA